MFITCPQCQSQYKLEPEQLGAGGRTVRCTDCRHTWFESPPGGTAPEPDKDQEIFSTILSTVNAKPSEPAFPAIPEERTLVARHETASPVITHNPLGVSATAFGGLTFCLCLSLTLAGVFLGKHQIVSQWPQAVLLYKTLGFYIEAPGEGLKFSEVVAERRIDKGRKALMVEGKITNMTEQPIMSPSFHVLLKEGREAVLREWTPNPGADEIAAGAAVPFTLPLPDAPAAGTVIEVRVKE